MIEILTQANGSIRAVATIDGKIVASFAGKQALGLPEFAADLIAAYDAEKQAEEQWRKLLAQEKAKKMLGLTREVESARDSHGNNWSDEC